MDEIFAHFIPKPGEDKTTSKRRLAYATWFVESFPSSEFKQEDYIMWFFLRYSVKLGVTLREKYLGIFMDAELKPLIAKNRIKITGTEMLSLDNTSDLETAVQLTRRVIFDQFYTLMNIPTDIEDFKASADAFMTKQLDNRLADLYQSGFEMISSRKNNFIGSKDALEFTRIESAKIEEIYDRDKLEELNSSDSDDDDDDGQFSFLFNLNIPAIDKDTLGVYSTQLFGLEAAPGAGKTRIALGVFVYSAAVLYKIDCCFYSLEQTKKEIKAMLVSRHIFTLYQIQISDKMILTKTIPPEHKDKYEAAKYDLFESGRYGKIHIVCESLYLHSFIDKMKMQDELHGPFDFFAVDYMALIEQIQEKGQWRIDDNRVTAAAYKRFKRYLRAANKAGLAINQYNSEGVKFAIEDKVPPPSGSAGGMEASRSVDYMLSMTFTPEMEAQLKRRLNATKKRGSSGVGSVLVETRLGVSYVYQQTTKL